jgi:5-methylcytosine-specific restriction protein A
MRAPTPCGEQGCHDYVVKYGKCQQHQRPPWQGTTRRQRLPTDWNTRRQLVFKRDGNICHICHQPGADTIDHIIPGDNHSLENLAPIHDNQPPHCHRIKTAKEANDIQAGNKIKKRF